MEQFNLQNYQDEIQAIAKEQACTLTVAVDKFILNLTTFNEYERGTGTLNYHVLGHQWGSLSSDQKIEQKQTMKKRLAEPSAGSKSRTRYRR